MQEVGKQQPGGSGADDCHLSTSHDGILKLCSQPSSAARGLLHVSGSRWYLSVTLEPDRLLMPAKFGRRHAGVPAEEAAKIGGILEPELGRDAGHRAGDVHQAAARFPGQSLLDEVEGST